jgi:hypothetical protein
MATNFSSESEWKLIKRDIDRGKPRAVVMEKYDIGEKKYYRVRKSTNFENYKKLTHEATRKRAKARDAAKHRDLYKICTNAKYNRRPYQPVEAYEQEKAWPTLLFAIVAAIVGFALIAGLIIFITR